METARCRHLLHPTSLLYNLHSSVLPCTNLARLMKIAAAPILMVSLMSIFVGMFDQTDSLEIPHDLLDHFVPRESYRVEELMLVVSSHCTFVDPVLNVLKLHRPSRNQIEVEIIQLPPVEYLQDVHDPLLGPPLPVVAVERFCCTVCSLVLPDVGAFGRHVRRGLFAIRHGLHNCRNTTILLLLMLLCYDAIGIKLQCRFCNRQFDSRHSQLCSLEHAKSHALQILSAHPNADRLSASAIFTILGKLYRKRNRSTLSTRTRLFACLQCTRLFTNVVSYVLHLQLWLHPEPRSFCGYCGQVVLTDGLTHFNDKHREGFICPAELSCPGSMELLHHMLVTHPETKCVFTLLHFSDLSFFLFRK